MTSFLIHTGRLVLIDCISWTLKARESKTVGPVTPFRQSCTYHLTAGPLDGLLGRNIFK